MAPIRLLFSFFEASGSPVLFFPQFVSIRVFRAISNFVGFLVVRVSLSLSIPLSLFSHPRSGFFTRVDFFLARISSPFFAHPLPPPFFFDADLCGPLFALLET